MSLIKKAIANSLVVTVINYGVFAIAIFVQALLARLLLPENFGSYVVALSFTEILFSILFFDTAQACIYLQKRKHIFGTALRVSLVLSLIILACLPLLYLILEFTFLNEIKHFVIALMIVKLFLLPAGVFAAKLEMEINFIRLGIFRGLGRITALFVGVFLAINGGGVWALIVIEGLTNFLILISAVFLGGYQLIKAPYSRYLLKPILRYARSNYTLRILEVLVARAHNVTFDLMNFSKKGLGVIDRALYIAVLPSTVTAAFHTKIAFALFGKIRNEKNEFETSLNLSLWALIRLTLIPTIWFVFYPETIVSILLGNQWSEAVPLVRSLALYAIAFLCFNILKQAFISSNKFKPLYIANLGFIIATVLSIVGLSLTNAGLLSFTWLYSLYTLTMTLYLLSQLNWVHIRYKHVFLGPLICFALCSGLSLVFPSGILGVVSITMVSMGYFIVANPSLVMLFKKVSK